MKADTGGPMNGLTHGQVQDGYRHACWKCLEQSLEVMYNGGWEMVIAEDIQKLHYI
jgi:hypothetical protein